MDETKIIRKCCACGCNKSRDELIKVTVNLKTSEVKILPDSMFMGRSVYLCKDLNCLEKAFKKGRIHRLLKIKPDETLKEKIRAVLEE